MAEDKPSSSSADASDGHEEGTISLTDYLEAECDLEEDARAVLGGSDMQNCTYDEGYVQRQALYSCATCSTNKKQPAGICLACSLECHDGHDLYELYTKRFFKCDCGNSKFEMECKLQPGKEASNADNKYNHNFEGVYCSCSRPYPDPDREEDGEMIQCCVCEDWYHDRHLSLGDTPVPSDYEEMICVNCVKQHSFLLNYHPTKISATDEEGAVDVTSSTDGDVTSTSSANADSTAKSESTASEPTSSASEVTPGGEISTPRPCLKLVTHTESECKTLFMCGGWREDLCRCTQCTNHYKIKNIEFLTDVNDPTHVYEQNSKNSGDGATSGYEKGLNALSTLGRAQQIELLSGYNDMKSSLADYLKKFAANNKVVREEDIQEFFEDYKKNKKQKLAMPPSSCS